MDTMDEIFGVPRIDYEKIARSRSKDSMSQLKEQEAASEQRAEERREKKGYRKFHRLLCCTF